MIVRFIRLDQTDFLLEMTKNKPIVVHEFENDIAVIWHIRENVLLKRMLDKLKT